MVTFQAGRLALFTVLAGLATACGREQQDWRSAESADTAEAWQRFLEQHPGSELVNQARMRIAQLEAQRDFQYAERQGTVEAYRDFLTRHPSGKWSEHARIRIEGFSLGSAPRIALPTPEEAAAFTGVGVRALRLATATVPPAATQPEGIPVGMVPVPTDDAQPQVGTGRAVPGEAAQAAPDLVIKPVSANDTAQTGYGVQLGAFGSEASADREWRRLQGRFGAELRNLSPHIVLAEGDSRQFYRLQAPASGEAEARAICDSLREQAQVCVPVLPR
jgi:cell division septation protein DedD